MPSMEFKNNARSAVADPLAQAAVTLNVATGEGANFPDAFPFLITIWDASTYPNPGDDPDMEIDKCTGRTADALTIVRGQEGTGDVEHALGERVAMLWTAGHFNDAATGIVTKLDTIETNAKDDQTASEVPIVDSGSIITATDVEDALQENRTAIDLNTAKDTNVTTNLSEGTNTETTVDVNSSDGSNATLLSASTLRAGLLTKAKFDEIVANTVKTTNATHTGDVTGSVALTIAADAVTYAKMQNVVNDERIWGRVSGADGVVEELTKAQVLSMLSVEDGADVTDTANVTSAGAFMDSEFPNQSFTNLLKNGDFESWSAGAAAVPDGWTDLNVTPARESTIKKYNTYSVKNTVDQDAIGYMYTDVLNYANYAGKTVTLAGWVYSTAASRIKVGLGDGIANVYSDYHSGNSTWELLTISLTLNASPTYLRVRSMYIDSGASIPFYTDGVMLVEGSVCPSFSQHPTDQIPIVLTAAPTDAGTNGETRWYAIAGAGGARRLYMSNGTDWKYIAIST